MKWYAGWPLLLAAACSRMGEPPGGPPDASAPVIIGTLPESTVVVPGFKDEAEFRFNEVVSEGSTPNFGLGTGDLEKLIVLSPTNEVPVIGWKKSRITVRPREGWKPNRVYRIELLTGLFDLRNNRSKTGRVITFTTGAPIPTRFIAGRVVDWTTSRASPQALVQAMLLPDSLPYRTTTDSTGRFVFGPLPDGEFVVAGAIDQNRNNRLDAREVFDTVRLAAGRDSVGEIWAFKHDTVPARIQALAKHDSLAIIVTFSQQLNPYQTFTIPQARVRLLPDSTDIEIETIVTEKLYDSLYRRVVKSDSALAADSVAKIRADSTARADSLRRVAEASRRRGRNTPPPRPLDEGPLTTRPPLSDRIVIRLRQPLVPGAKYVVETNGIESVSRVAGRAIQGFQVPEEKPPAKDSTAADSTARDSTARTPAPRDTVRRPPAPADTAAPAAPPVVTPAPPPPPPRDTVVIRPDTTPAAPPQPTPAAPVAAAPTTGGFRVQAMAAPTMAAARDAVTRLRAMGFDSVIVTENGLHKVRAGPFPTKAAANAALRRIRAALGDGPFVVPDT